ncbi:hypothetical protein PHLCEN_2v10962 [Hermanssonia centrifuga]|uniref:Uncharacterized protein n=1 Tax=Hermanssonia centrifuga TaxID=98765 RepID=A0A2R6NLD7_9APHY|nr:hypothetical protein PHLCEN_2v10962 [Hermanssonia centrifuga]
MVIPTPTSVQVWPQFLNNFLDEFVYKKYAVHTRTVWRRVFDTRLVCRRSNGANLYITLFDRIIIF